MPTRLDQSSCVCYNNFLFRIKMRVKPPRDSYGLRASDWPFSVETMFAFPVFAWPFSVETMFVFPVFACQPADDTHKSRSFSFARQCSLFHSWLELSCYAGTTHLCWKKCWADLVSECSIVCFAVFDMSVVDRPLYHLLSQNLLLMEVDPGKFTAVVVILSHIVRSWFSSGTVDISVIQGELASFRTEVLRAEHTVRLANQALAECVDTLSVHSWIFRTLGLFICLAIIGVSLWWIQFRHLLAKTSRVEIEKDIIISSAASPVVSPVDQVSEKQQNFKPGPGSQLRSGPVRPSDLRRLADQHGC